MSRFRAVTAEDKKFEALHDANTLIDAKAVQKDPARLNAAINHAKTEVEDARNRATAANQVAKMKAKAVSKSKSKKK